MIADPSAFDRKQYRFLLETGFARANRFLGPLASFSGLFGFIAVANFVAGLILGEYVHILAGDPEIVIVQSLLWATPGLISNLLVLFFILYLGDIVIDMARTVSPYLANINLRSYLSTFFRSKNQLFFATLFGTAAAFFQIRYLIISPWTDWAHLYVVSHWVTLALATVVIFSTTLTYFLISLLFYQCVASGYIVYRVGKSMRQDLGSSEAESTDLQWLGRVGLGASIAWMASVGVILLQALVAPVVWWSILQVMLFAASCIAIFVLPFTSSHKALSSIKSRALSDIRTRIWERYQKAMDSRSEVEARLALDQIRALQVFEARIVRRRTWPITGRMLMGFMLTFTASNLPFIRTILDVLAKYRPW